MFASTWLPFLVGTYGCFNTASRFLSRRSHCTALAASVSTTAMFLSKSDGTCPAAHARMNGSLTLRMRQTRWNDDLTAAEHACVHRERAGSQPDDCDEDRESKNQRDLRFKERRHT